MIIKLEDVTQFISGKAFTSKDFTDTPQSERALPIIRIQNVNSEEAEFKYWDKEYEEKYIVNSGDLLMSLSGDFKLKIWNGPRALLNQRVVKIKVKKNVNKYYLFKYLQSKIYILMNMGNSSIINNLSLKTLKNFNIELPNLTIQNNIEKIIQKLDKQLLKRKEQLKLLDELGESLFNATKIKLKNIKLSDVVNDIYAGKSLASKEPSNYKVIKTGAVSFEYFNETEFKYLPNDYIPNKNHFIDKGELLVSRMNTSELVGAVSYVFDSVKNLTIPDRIWKLILDKEQVNPIYLWYVLNESTFRKHVTNIATGTSGSMKNISQKNYLKSRVNLPEVNKQNEFAEKIEKIEELKKQCQKSLEYYEELYETLLHKAFNGELFNE